MFINIHTHHPNGHAGTLEIENLHFEQLGSGLTPYYSAGLHPWFLTENTASAAAAWLQEKAAQPQVLAIGEAGLDKITAAPWTLQLSAFETCVGISELSNKPLIIHCVRAYAEIVALKKQWKPRQPWILHGFNKNIQTADMLLQAGCILSFGKALFNQNSHAASVLASIPATSLLLETDDADLPIQNVYERAAALRELSLEDLQAQQQHNFKLVFKQPLTSV